MTTNSTAVQLYNMLHPKLGSHASESLIHYVDTKVETELNKKKDTLATKQDLSELSKTLSKELTNRMDNHFRWMISLILGQTALYTGLIYFLVKSLS